jgi:Ca2+-binding RTX toxin-like protein
MAKLSTVTFSNSGAAIAEVTSITDLLLGMPTAPGAQKDVVSLNLLAGNPGSSSLWAIGQNNINTTTHANMTQMPTGTSGNIWVPNDLITQQTTNSFVTGLGATVTLNASGQVTYDISHNATLIAQVDNLAAGATITDTFLYAIKMAGGTVSWNTESVNLVGSAANITASHHTVVEDVSGGVSVHNTFHDTATASATTALGNSTTYTITAAAGNLGTLACATGTFTGSHSFSYSVTDDAIYNGSHAGFGEIAHVDSFTVTTANGTTAAIQETIYGNVHAATFNDTTQATNGITLTEGTTAALNLAASDHDDNANLTYTITGLANGVTITDGNGHTYSGNNITISNANVQSGLTLHAGVESESQGTLTVQVANTEYDSTHNTYSATLTTTETIGLTVKDMLPGFASAAAISGTVQEGQTVHASATGLESDWAVTYQWQQDGNNIGGATGTSYTLTEADEGHTIGVVATVTNDNGLTATSSAGPTVVLDQAAGFTAGASISGTAQEGQTLTASGKEADWAVTYQWQQDGHDISGATGATYVVQEGDEGHTIDVVATVTNDDNLTATSTSAATGSVLDQAAGFSAGASISGTAQEGQTLTASATGKEADWAVTYQWQQDGHNISGATGATYVVQDGDEGHTIDVVATVTNDDNLTATSTSAATGSVLDQAAGFTAGASISGTAQEGQTLTASATGKEADWAVTYQWQQDGHNITGATGTTYALTEANEGHTIDVVATVTNGNGATATSTSLATAAVLDTAPAFASGPTITGTAQEGQTLTAHATAVQSDNSITYQWQQDGQDISGATGATYVLGEADENHRIDVVATVHNDNGATVSATSVATGMVVDVPPTLSVTVSGNAVSGQTLTANPTQSSDETMTVHYQWEHSADGTTWTNIAGATGQTYVVQQSDVNDFVRVEASATDDTNQSVTADSSATAKVAGDLLHTETLVTLEQDVWHSFDQVLLSNDLPHPGLTVTSISAPAGDGTFTQETNHSWTYTAPLVTGNSTSFTFTYTVTDGTNTATETDSMTVLHVTNGSPTINISNMTYDSSFMMDTNAGNSGVSFTTGAGQDVLIGGAANDTLSSNGGNDILVGGGGGDALNGGAGNDTFVYQATTDSQAGFSKPNVPMFDTITGFTAASDKIDFGAADLGLGFTNVAGLTGTVGVQVQTSDPGTLAAHSILVVQATGGTTATIYANASGVSESTSSADMTIQLTGVSGQISASDIHHA